jgi:hypothetical protein
MSNDRSSTAANVLLVPMHLDALCLATMAALIGGYIGTMAATTRSDGGRPAART